MTEILDFEANKLSSNFIKSKLGDCSPYLDIDLLNSLIQGMRCYQNHPAPHFCGRIAFKIQAKVLILVQHRLKDTSVFRRNLDHPVIAVNHRGGVWHKVDGLSIKFNTFHLVNVISSYQGGLTGEDSTLLLVFLEGILPNDKVPPKFD